MLPMLLAAALLLPTISDQKKAEPQARSILSLELEAARARSLNHWYSESDQWALRAIVLCTYGPRWHPKGSQSLAAALRSKQPELWAFAVETLLKTDSLHLPIVMTPDLVDALLTKGLSFKPKLLKSGTLQVLERGLPASDAQKPSEWKRWWRIHKADYAPPVWKLPALPGKLPETESQATSFVARAFDLNSAGMEIAIVIDTTGSMQRTIDAAAVALSDITLIMEGIAPKLRVGLVEYKDLKDMSGGAHQLEKLTKKIAKVRTRLSKLVASGGGDFPESILGGVRLALDPKLGWKREANKLLVVIGDAPQRKKNREQLYALAKAAHESPFGVDASDIIEVTDMGGTHSKRGVRPFVISAIGVGDRSVAKQTSITMRKLAEVGGGSYAEVLVNKGSKTASQSVAIVQHILTLAFGSRWAPQMKDFLTIYLRYRDAGCFE